MVVEGCGSFGNMVLLELIDRGGSIGRYGLCRPGRRWLLTVVVALELVLASAIKKYLKISHMITY